MADVLIEKNKYTQVRARDTTASRCVVSRILITSPLQQAGASSAAPSLVRTSAVRGTGFLQSKGDFRREEQAHAARHQLCADEREERAHAAVKRQNAEEGEGWMHATIDRTSPALRGGTRGVGTCNHEAHTSSAGRILGKRREYRKAVWIDRSGRRTLNVEVESSDNIRTRKFSICTYACLLHSHSQFYALCSTLIKCYPKHHMHLWCPHQQCSTRQSCPSRCLLILTYSTHIDIFIPEL